MNASNLGQLQYDDDVLEVGESSSSSSSSESRRRRRRRYMMMTTCRTVE